MSKKNKLEQFLEGLEEESNDLSVPALLKRFGALSDADDEGGEIAAEFAEDVIKMFVKSGLVRDDNNSYNQVYAILDLLRGWAELQDAFDTEQYGEVDTPKLRKIMDQIKKKYK